MSENDDLNHATFVKDPETGEVLTVERDLEYSRALSAFYSAECKHLTISQFRVKVAGGSVQLRNCCTECGERVGTALAQNDKAWVASLPFQPEAHAATYKSRREVERQALLLGLARRQYAERGRFTKSYRAYLASDVWKNKRERVLKRCGGICEGCGEAKATEVHHFCYDHLFDEFLFELVGLCHNCHERITAERRAILGPDDPTDEKKAGPYDEPS